MIYFCPSNLDIDEFHNSSHVLPILGVLEGFPYGISQFCNNLFINYQFSKHFYPHTKMLKKTTGPIWFFSHPSKLIHGGDNYK